MRWIAINRHQNNLILTDSCSVLQAIQSRTFGKHYILSKILLLHHYLTVSNLTIHFLWVPSHSGILGNETADCLTKSVFRSNNLVAETGAQTTEIAAKLSHSEVKSTIRDHCLEKWNHKYIHSTTGGQYRWLFPRIHTKLNHQNNLIFRLQTGHCRLKHHLHRIGSHQTDLCTVCQVQESVPHFLLQCPIYSLYRTVMKNYVESIGLKFDLQTLLSNKNTYDCVCLFIKSCKKVI